MSESTPTPPWGNTGGATQAPPRPVPPPQRQPAPARTTVVESGRRSEKIVIAVVVTALIAVIASLATVALVLMRDNGSSTVSQPASAVPTSTVTDLSQVADNAACDGHTVKLMARPGGNFGPEPLPKDAPAEANQKILDYAQHDPVFLYGYYIFSPIYGKYPNIKGPQDLVTKMENGSCYNAAGQELYNDWAWIWKEKAKLTPRDHMPASGVITGATESGQVFQQSGKINDSYGYDVSYEGFGPEYDHISRGLCDQPGKEGATFVPGAVSSPPGAPPLVEHPPTEQPQCTGINCTPVEQCPPGASLPYPQCFPVEQCPPGDVVDENGNCKDYGNGVGSQLPTPLQPNPLPASPELEEPDQPDQPSMTRTYEPPPTSQVVVAPAITPRPSDTPRTTQAPAPEAPRVSTVVTTDSSGTPQTTEVAPTVDLNNGEW